MDKCTTECMTCGEEVLDKNIVRIDELTHMCIECFLIDDKYNDDSDWWGHATF